MMSKKWLLVLSEECRTLLKLKTIHAQSTIQGQLKNHQSLASKLLNSYTKLGHPQYAHKLFNQIHHPDSVSWTSLIHLHLHNRNPKSAFSAFSQLINCGLRPDSYSVVAALVACGRNEDLIGGKLVHGMVLRFQLGSNLNPIVGNALIDMYSRNGEIEVAIRVFEIMWVKDVASWNSLINGFVLCGVLDDAQKLFDEMPERNSVSWTVLITGYVRRKALDNALEVFKEMKVEGKSQPTAMTFVSILAGCADVGALDLGRSIHGYVNKTCDPKVVTVSNALMDMYSKSGDLDASMKIFSGIGVKKDVFSWTTIISGYANHGKAKQALEAFEVMLETGIAPNEVTFLAILSACCHAGMVIQGQRLFREMVERYSLKPGIEHYGCLLDLLGRAGHLEEAKLLIETMVFSPDAPIWRSFLNACLLHGNLDLAEIAGKKVLELDPDDDGVYVILWKICTALDKQEDGLEIRKMMRNQMVKKTAGCSWIELNGIVHRFLAEDTISRDASREIYWVLESMSHWLCM